jgi:hypothetical protein
MAVKVVGNDVRTHDGIEHADGNDIAVREGHLFVLAGGPRTVAVYAPGQWLWAEVTQ